jgi:hypothetical protein
MAAAGDGRANVRIGVLDGLDRAARRAAFPSRLLRPETPSSSASTRSEFSDGTKWTGHALIGFEGAQQFALGTSSSMMRRPRSRHFAQHALEDRIHVAQLPRVVEGLPPAFPGLAAS